LKRPGLYHCVEEGNSAGSVYEACSKLSALTAAGKKKGTDYDLTDVLAPKGGWHTSTATMMLDEDEGGAKGPDAAGTSEPGDATMGVAAPQPQDVIPMETLESGRPSKSSRAKAVTPVPGGLGVVTHSLKRGDRTHTQRQRKVKKLVKVRRRGSRRNQGVARVCHDCACSTSCRVFSHPVVYMPSSECWNTRQAYAITPLASWQAIERLDKTSVRVEAKKQRKTSKLSLKHMY
jgi:hypothetical protein